MKLRSDHRPFYTQGDSAARSPAPDGVEVDVGDRALNPGLLIRAQQAPLTPGLSLPGIAQSQFAPLQNDWPGRVSLWSFPAQMFMILSEQKVTLLSD